MFRAPLHHPVLCRKALGRVIFICGMALLAVSACKRSWDQEPIDYIGREPFSFFVAGHAYGNGAHADSSDSMYPPFIAALEEIAAEPDLELGVFTGDFVQSPDSIRYARLERDLDLLDIPLRFVPGNHDLAWNGGNPLPGEFDRHFPARRGALRHRRSLFLFLDSNEHHWRIEGQQLSMLQRELSDLEEVDQVFAFVHNNLWWSPEASSPHHAAYPNSTWNRHPDLRFWEDVFPLLEAADRPVWVFAGDAGAYCNGSETSYWQSGQVHLITNGMGCADKSSYVLVRVDAEGVSVELRGLAGAEMGELADWEYGP